MSNLVFLFYGVICDAYRTGDAIGYILTWVLGLTLVAIIIFCLKYLGTPDNAPKE